MNSIQLLASVFLVVFVSNMGVSFGQTTTQGPANTTSTTSEPPTTTTTVPAANTTTTTQAPAKNTTTTAPTTTSPTTTASTTTAPKKDPKNTYNVTEDNVQCIEMKARIDFAINYETEKSGNKTIKVAIPKDATSSGTCGNKTQTLKITFFSGWEMDFEFTLDKNSKYHASKMTLKYKMDDHFDAPKDKGDSKTVTFDAKNYLSANKDGYICKSKISEKKDDVTINTSDLQYKAFNKESDVTFNDSALECSADEDTNSIVPIAVGAALAGLVVIVLIAYLIGRKRTRKTGYESV